MHEKWIMDLHNHSVWSDGENTICELAEHAKQTGLTALGICDHIFAQETKSLNLSDGAEYLENINDIREDFEDDIKVFAGLEIPIAVLNQSLSDDIVDIFNKMDYVLIEDFAYLSNKADWMIVKENLDKIRCKKGMAHTIPTTDALQFMIGNSLFWELNVNPAYDIFEIAQIYENKEAMRLFESLNRNLITVSVGSDSHSLDEYPLGRIECANAIVRDYLHKVIIEAKEE